MMRATSLRPSGNIALHNSQDKTSQEVLFAELNRANERLKATQEILQVISQTKDDEQPVFDAILRNAAQLCNAPVAALLLLNEERSTFGMAAHWGEWNDPLGPVAEWTLDAPLPVAQALREARTIHVEDMKKSAPYVNGDTTYRRLVDTEGIRTRICVPLLSGGVAFGTIVLSRLKLLPFDKGEVALIESFAAQAVIAIENIRQFRELRTRLEREAATREILLAISQSRDDERPVFDVVLRNAANLCGASMASLNITSEDRSQVVKVADWGNQFSGRLAAGTTAWPIEAENAPSVCVREGRIVHLHDMADTDLYRSGDAKRVAAVDAQGIRTFLAVPLFSDNRSVGCISVYRDVVSPFAADEIALVETFAAQAVIAIENARQFKALETLNTELESRVEEQVGEIERMGRLKRFLPAAVADTVVSSGSQKILSSHRALLGVLFCDIRGFTAFCETAEPEETIEVLQTYHQEMGKLINAHGAGVDHRMGDGIMVLFNDPLPCNDPAGDAVRLAIAMRARMTELCKTWKRMGYRLGFGVGVSLGYATVGMVGFEGRFDYTASGTAINLASRLCDEAEDGEILLSPRAAIAVEDGFQVESRGELILKGLREPLEVFRLAVGAAA
jgi:class 3 adenylate cyclase